MVSLIDPLEGQRYVEQVNSEGQYGYLDHIDNITSEINDYVNSTTNAKLNWRIISSCSLDSGESLENWHN